MSHHDRAARAREMQGRMMRARAAGYSGSWLYRHSRLWKRLIDWCVDFR